MFCLLLVLDATGCVSRERLACINTALTTFRCFLGDLTTFRCFLGETAEQPAVKFKFVQVTSVCLCVCIIVSKTLDLPGNST